MAEQILIKADPDAESPLADDELDDATDLEFFNGNADPANPYNNVYLARVPAYLWSAWEKTWENLGDDDEIQIGSIRIWSENDSADESKRKVQMLLRGDIAQHQGVPKEYDLNRTESGVKNTFLFSEQDLPSYAAKNKEKANALAEGIPAHLLRKKQQQSEPQQQNAERGKRRFDNVRRAVPKKTSIYGRVMYEVNAVPFDNAETNHILALRAIEAQRPKNRIEIKDYLPPDGMQMMNENQFQNFIKTTDKPTKKQKMENKTARWAENILMDRLAECFSRYKYWSMKSLRNEIPQPEAFIRECLDRIAVLHRTGRFANNWALKPEYQNLSSQKTSTTETAAPETNADDGEDDEDEGDIKMEDVF